jgi:hypothetical protein
MIDVLMFILINRLWPLVLFGICFIAFANYLSETVESRLSANMIRLAGVFLLAPAPGLFLYAYVNSDVQFRR